MKPINDRSKNRRDFKWAHPGTLSEWCYSMENMDATCKVIENMSEEEVDEKRYKEMGPALLDVFAQTEGETWAKWRSETTMKEYYTEHGCPEEPDAPPVRMLVVTPNDVKEGERLPVLFTIDGGGFTFNGMPEVSISGWYKIGLNCNMRHVMVSLQYRLAPHSKYPKAVNDCHAAYLWMLENADKLSIDVDRIVIGGGSAGAQLTLCLGFRLKKYQYYGHMPRGLVANTPAIDDVAYTDSFRYSYEDENGSHWGWDYFMGIDSARKWLGDRFGDPTLPPEAVPSRATLEDVKGFPPVWFPSAAENDLSRDSVCRFASLLHQAGVFCDLHVWGGTSHLALVGNPNGADGEIFARMWDVTYGAVRDALEFDFRRTWL